MKRLIFIIAFILFGIPVFAQQIGYLSEAIKISRLLKNSQPVSFNTDSGIPVPTGERSIGAVMALTNKIVELKQAQLDKESNIQPQAPQVIKQETTGGIPVGAVGQPQSQPAPNVTAANPAAGNSTVNIGKRITVDGVMKKEIEMEVTWMLFLAFDNKESHFNDVKDKFPKYFEYIDFLSGAMGNSGAGLTNFAFSESAIIYGIVDFTLKRAKEEMVNTYLEKWYKKLDANQNTKKLLPQSISVLKAFNEENSLNLAKYGDKWKAAFQEDLRNLPVVFQDETFLDSLKIGMNVENREEYISVIAGGNKIVYDLYLKKHLVNILSDLSVRYLSDADEQQVFKKLIVLSDVLLKAGGTMTNNETYQAASLQDLGKMDVESWRIFFKLTYIRHMDAMTFCFNKAYSDEFLTTLLTNEKVNRLAALYRNSLSLISNYQQMISVKTNSAETKLTFEESRRLFELSFQFTSQIGDYLTLLGKNNKVDVVLKNIKPYYTALSEIGEGISNKQYGAVLDGSISILRISNPTSEKYLKVIEHLQVFGSFMVNIIQADSSEKVEAALDELIPKGQYKLKNTQTFTVSLSAFPGVFAGYERIKKYPVDGAGNSITSAPKLSSWAFSPSVYLPIGIDFSIGSKSKKSERDFSSTNFLFQIADLGAVANYRLSDNDDEETNPEISFKQVLSPGFSIMHHIKNSPLVYGAGVNYQPSLRKINQNGNEYKSPALRFGLFLAVDVTFFNLFSSKSLK
jgi:hypothetical protein